MNRVDTIYTDANGRPFEKPRKEDYASAVEFIRAYHAYRDAVADCGNRAFDAQWRKAIKRHAAKGGSSLTHQSSARR